MRAAGSCVAAGAGGPYAVSSATATAAMSKLPNTTPHALFIFAMLRTDDCYCNRPRPECCYEPVAIRKLNSFPAPPRIPVRAARARDRGRRCAGPYLWLAPPLQESAAELETN